MAYQLKRESNCRSYEEDLELVDENGNVVKVIHISLDSDIVVRNLSEKHLAIVRALEMVKTVDTKADPVGAINIAGDAVKDMLEAVFGVENAQDIVDFYGGRYMEIIANVIPFVLNVVVPEIRRMAKNNQKAIAAGYRRPRGLFGRK